MAIRALLATILFCLAPTVLRAGEGGAGHKQFVVELLDGKRISGRLDRRTTTDRLWLRWDCGGTSRLRVIPRARVRSIYAVEPTPHSTSRVFGTMAAEARRVLGFPPCVSALTVKGQQRKQGHLQPNVGTPDHRERVAMAKGWMFLSGKRATRFVTGSKSVTPLSELQALFDRDDRLVLPGHGVFFRVVNLH